MSTLIRSGIEVNLQLPNLAEMLGLLARISHTHQVYLLAELVCSTSVLSYRLRLVDRPIECVRNCPCMRYYSLSTRPYSTCPESLLHEHGAVHHTVRMPFRSSVTAEARFSYPDSHCPGTNNHVIASVRSTKESEPPTVITCPGHSCRLDQPGTSSLTL